jgi:hypothetical protein
MSDKPDDKDKKAEEQERKDARQRADSAVAEAERERREREARGGRADARPTIPGTPPGGSRPTGAQADPTRGAPRTFSGAGGGGGGGDQGGGEEDQEQQGGQGPAFRTAADIAGVTTQGPELQPDDARSGLSLAVGLEEIEGSEVPPGPGGEAYRHVRGPTQMPVDPHAAGLDTRFVGQQPDPRVMTQTGEIAAGPRPYTYIERTGPRMTQQAAPADNRQVPMDHYGNVMETGAEEEQPGGPASEGMQPSPNQQKPKE